MRPNESRRMSRFCGNLPRLQPPAWSLRLSPLYLKPPSPSSCLGVSAKRPACLPCSETLRIQPLPLLIPLVFASFQSIKPGTGPPEPRAASHPRVRSSTNEPSAALRRGSHPSFLHHPQPRRPPDPRLLVATPPSRWSSPPGCPSLAAGCGSARPGDPAKPPRPRGARGSR